MEAAGSRMRSATATSTGTASSMSSGSALEYRALRGEQELDAWLDLIDSCFGSCRAYFEDHFKLDPLRDTSLIFVAIEDGKMVGSTRIFQREINVRGHGRQSMAGVGDVCTLSTHRGLKIQNNLMNMAMEEAKKRNFSIASLHSGENVVDMYRKFGFESTPCIYAYESWDRSALDHAASSWPHEVQAMEDILVRQQGVPDFVPDLYAKTMEAFTGPIARSREYWSTWVAQQSKETFSTKLVVISKSADGRQCAYLMVGAMKKSDLPDHFAAERHSLRLKVLDFLCEPPDLARVALGALAACAARHPGCRSRPASGASAADVEGQRFTEGSGGPGDPLLLAGIPAAMVPAPAPASGCKSLKRKRSACGLRDNEGQDPGNGITRVELRKEKIMYKKLCAEDAVWNAVASADDHEHAFFAVDDY